VVVENRTGGGLNIGGAAAARAKPDGYTLLVSSAGLFTINPFLYKDQGFDPARDFVPITEIASAPYVLAAYPGFPVETVQQFVKWGRDNPGKLSWASSPPGTIDHLAGELFRMQTGIEMVNIPYRGGAPAMADVLGGRVQATFVTIPTSLPHVKAGKLRALGVTSKGRAGLLPDVPTIAESGIADYEVLTWYGVWAPTGTPQEIVHTIHADIKKVVQQPEIQAWMKENGFEPVSDTPAKFADFVRQETAKYGGVIGKLGLPKE
jgi:tripartite-type tricarboxylate transporter receptor subunit TctC